MEELGLLIFIRPGPYICSEWDFGGFPNWLITKDCELRSLETNYLKYCTRYLKRVNSIIKPHLITKGGNIFLYQVENEFEVGDIPYHLKLKEIAGRDGIDVPFATNENFWIRGTKIIEGPDPYLRSWVLSEATSKVKSLIETQPDKPAFAQEVGTHMFVRFYGQLPFSDGYRPPELDEVYLKSLIGAGISGYNWYMYHGGTNIGYWTARDIATTYDFEAPIREWGELGSRYWISRRLGGFLESFQKELLETTPVDGDCFVDEKGIEVYVRKNKEKAFLFLANPYLQERSFKITIKEPKTGKKMVVPGKEKFHLPGYSMVILPVNLKISAEWTIFYSTSEMFYLVDNHCEKTLILYRETGFDGEIALKRRGKKSEIVNYTHKKEPQYINLEGKENLRLIILDKETAGKTWFFNYQGKKYPVISNIYFLEKEKENKDNITLTFQVREGKNWLQIPFRAKQVKVDGQEIPFDCDQKNQTIQVNLPEEKFPEIFYDLSGKWKVREERLKDILEDNRWLDWQSWEGLEKYGFLKNGYSWYQTIFKISKNNSPLYLILTGFQDEISIYLNNQYVNSGRDSLKCEVSSYLKEGDNHLVLLTESGGHPCGGEKTFNGINCPIYLSSNEDSIKLEEWRRKSVPIPYPHKSLIENKEPEIKPAFADAEWEKVRVDKKWDSRFFKNPYEESFVWYRTQVEIPTEFEGKGLSLDFEEGLKDKIYLFVNGKFSGLRENAFLGLTFSFDISERVKPGKNSLVVGIKADRWTTYFGLHGRIKITAYDQCLNRGWKIREGLWGQKISCFKVDFDDSEWEEKKTQDKTSPPGSLLWFRKKVKINLSSDYVCPLKLTLKETTEKALIYFNGSLIGRYSARGCQEDFYIYEDLIKEDNLVAILVDGRSMGAKLGKVYISPYYLVKRVEVTLWK